MKDRPLVSPMNIALHGILCDLVDRVKAIEARPPKPRWDLVILGCGQDKAPTRRPALELYTGPVFKAHRTIAEALGLPIYGILSALHRLVPPDRELEPYNHRDPGNAWNEEVAELLLAATVGIEDPTVLVLAGAEYTHGWKRLVAGDVTVDEPLRGLMVGERRQFAEELAIHGPLPPAPHRPVRAYLLERAEAFRVRALERRRRPGVVRA